MEIAIPLVALGGMYIVSNQGQKTKAPKQESYQNLNQPKALPNTNIPPQNYPVSNTKQLLDTVQRYPNPNTATDKYFDQNAFEERQRAGVAVGQNPQEIYSLTGNYLASEEFKHNNMVPFYGGKIKGQLYHANTTETILDNMAGTGSQTIKKIEQAPLFKPEENVQWAFGAPNMSDFYQSRVAPALKNNMVKPFQSVHVGPGLDHGYSSNGSGGYNAGMEARDHWLPKTVDELRIATNPKEEFSLMDHEGPAQAVIKNVGILGRVEKNHPDTFFINTQDRWLTTTGAEKMGRVVAEEVQKTSHRNDTTQHYTGTPSATLKTASYVPKRHEPSKRVVLPPKHVGVSNASGKGPLENHVHMDSFTNYNNHRATNVQPDTMRSGFSRAIGAAIAPLMDILNPTRKEETSCNYRVYGNMGSTVPKDYVMTPGDVPNTTIKETTLYQTHGNIGNQLAGAYEIKEYLPFENQRDTTTEHHVMGAAGAKYGEMNYDHVYRQTNNELKEHTATHGSRLNHGNTNTFHANVNVSMSRQDCDRDNNRLWAPSAVVPTGPSMQTYGKINMPQYKNECITCDRIDGDLLKPFLENPYTHSLTNSV